MSNLELNQFAFLCIKDPSYCFSVKGFFLSDSTNFKSQWNPVNLFYTCSNNFEAISINMVLNWSIFLYNFQGGKHHYSLEIDLEFCNITATCPFFLILLRWMQVNYKLIQLGKNVVLSWCQKKYGCCRHHVSIYWSKHPNLCNNFFTKGSLLFLSIFVDELTTDAKLMKHSYLHIYI